MRPSNAALYREFIDWLAPYLTAKEREAVVRAFLLTTGRVSVGA